MKFITIYTNTRETSCYADHTWDNDSFVLQSSISCLENAIDNRSQLQKNIELNTGVHPSEYTLLLGELEWVIDENNRIESLEIRTNPAKWKVQSLTPIPGVPENVWIDFQVTYDENRHTYIELSNIISYDPVSEQLAINFSDIVGDHHWFAVAENLFLALDDQHHLVSLRFLHIQKNWFNCFTV